MKILTKNLNPQLLSGSVGLLQTAVPELTPKNLVEAITSYGEKKEKLLSYSEVAEKLGVSRMTVHRMVLRNELPRVKISKRSVRIPSSAVDILLNTEKI